MSKGQHEECQALAHTIADALNETKSGPRLEIEQIVLAFGLERATDLLNDALAIEQAGGEMLPSANGDGSHELKTLLFKSKSTSSSSNSTSSPATRMPLASVDTSIECSLLNFVRQASPLVRVALKVVSSNSNSA